MFLRIFLPHKFQIVLLVNLTKRKKHTFVNLTKPELFMFRPHKLQIVLLVNLTKRKKQTFVLKEKHMFVNLTKLKLFMFRPVVVVVVVAHCHYCCSCIPLRRCPSRRRSLVGWLLRCCPPSDFVMRPSTLSCCRPLLPIAICEV